jgi:hypothetical protein
MQTNQESSGLNLQSHRFASSIPKILLIPTFSVATNLYSREPNKKLFSQSLMQARIWFSRFRLATDLTGIVSTSRMMGPTRFRRQVLETSHE